MNKNLLNRKISLLLIIFILSIFFIPTFYILAQNEDVFIEMTPEIPGPNQEVILNIVSYTADLDRAQIFWYLNDKLLSSGTGKKTFSFTTKGVGETSVVDIVIKPQNISRVDKNIKITPSEVDILWETDGYVPSFYKGKSLPSSEGVIKVVAFPNLTTSNGTKLQSNDLVYQWKKDYKILGGLSGYGKRVITFDSGYLFNIENIEVNVSSLGGSLNAKNRVNIEIGEPKILFYEKHPLLGIKYNKSIKEELLLNKEEVIIVAEPYFFSPGIKESSQLSYKWSLNNEVVDSSNENKSEITLRQEGGISGTSQISLEIENITKILQTIKENFTINFEPGSDFRF